ncbi:MAG TPA: glycosyltransferase family 39 protein [Anaerolineales bacterium]|nr:glycosyltransferase family 39 protein [Anaerolineales bacterium]
MSRRLQSVLLPAPRRWILWVAAIPALLLFALVLTWAASGFRSLQDWVPFVAALLLGALILWVSWWALKADRWLSTPAWLGWLLVGAAALRLAVGVLWFLALPAVGYGNPAEVQGYVMADAQVRDQAAWELSQSGKPLSQAFRGYRKADQYGGLLYLSAFTYRYLGGVAHQPLQIVVITAAFSTLAVLFTWALARRAWNQATANLAAWALALFPEAILLGSSQMREAFTVTLAIAAFYGLVRYWQERTWQSLGWIVGALIFSLPFSPPFAALLLGLLGIQALFMGKRRILRQRRLWLVLITLALLAAIGVWISWDRFAPVGVNNPIALVGWWIKKSAGWQAYLSEQASGWIQRVFNKSLPIWAQGPFLVLYGVVRPFLPAALVDNSITIWRGIAIWRSVGWTLLLSFLTFGTLLAWSRASGRGLVRGLSVVIWVVLLLASFRGGGDQWDNPRYRAAFAGLQASLAAWAWMEHQRSADPWLRRILIAVGVTLAWFLPWYLRRYTLLHWPVVDLFKTIGLGLASAALLLFWDWARRKSP